MSEELIEITPENFWDIYNMFRSFEYYHGKCIGGPMDKQARSIEQMGYNGDCYYIYFKNNIGLMHSTDHDHSKTQYYTLDNDGNELIFDTWEEAVVGREENRVVQIKKQIEKKKFEIEILEQHLKELFSPSP